MRHRGDDRSPIDFERACDVLEAAAREGFSGFGGWCGPAAIAINKALFGGQGAYWGACNSYQWREHGRFAGHVAVAVGEHLWDAEGVWEGGAKHLPGEPPEDFASWGMLPPDDPDYAWPGGKAGALANDVEILKLTERRIRHVFRDRAVGPIVDHLLHVRKRLE